MDIAAIHQEAKAAAEKAAAEMLARIGGDRMACGFAWVNIYGVNLATKQGKEFKRLGFTKGYGRKAPIELWNPSGSPVQNIDTKEAGARAYAEVFKRHGFEAYGASRLD
jgi:hypothetical protein